MSFSQKNELTSLKVFTIKNSKLEIRNEHVEKLEKGKENLVIHLLLFRE